MKCFITLLVLGTCIRGQGEKLYNQLTPEEESSGYELLFDGTNLDKWKSYKVDRTRESWKPIKKGDHNVLRVVAGDVGHIFTKDATYQNFDLKIEWLTPAKGNSGIFIRFVEDAGSDWGGNSGPEAQIVDLAHSDSRGLLTKPGACYDMFGLDPGTEEWFNGTDEFNEFRIIAFNKRVAHYGNGMKLLEYEMLTDEWNRAFNASKYSGKALWKTVHPGSIYLQHHGELGIEFRNIRVKKLGDDEDPWAEGSPYLEAGKLVKELTFDDNLFAAEPEKPGCPDPDYEEYDPTRTVDDMSLCNIVNVRGKNGFFSNLGKPIRIQQHPGSIVLELPFVTHFSAALLDLSGSVLFTLPETQTASAVFDTQTLSPGLYIINIAKGMDYIQKRVFIQ